MEGHQGAYILDTAYMYVREICTAYKYFFYTQNLKSSHSVTSYSGYILRICAFAITWTMPMCPILYLKLGILLKYLIMWVFMWLFLNIKVKKESVQSLNLDQRDNFIHNFWFNDLLRLKLKGYTLNLAFFVSNGWIWKICFKTLSSESKS
jgi:hypothetical protein